MALFLRLYILYDIYTYSNYLLHHSPEKGGQRSWEASEGGLQNNLMRESVLLKTIEKRLRNIVQI